MIIAISIIIGSCIIYRGIKGLAFIIFESALRSSIVANFSRFGDFDESRMAIMDTGRGYFMRGHTLWVGDVTDGELDKVSARPVDLFNRDSVLLKEARSAVEILNRDIQDQT